MKLVSALLAALVLAGCARVWVRTGASGADVPGAAVQETIDRQFGAALKASNPELRTGKAHCPDRVDLSNGKKGYCSLPVGGTDLPIEVTAGKTFASYEIRERDALMVMDDLERFLRQYIRAEYGVDGTPRCGEPRVRVLAVGSRMRCGVTTEHLHDGHVDLKVMNDAGRVFVFLIPGLPSHMAAFRPYLSAHKAGRSTVVPGPLVAEFIRRSALTGPSTGGNETTYAVSAVNCPPRLDLTRTNRGFCFLTLAGKRLRMLVSMNDVDGIVVRPLQSVIDTKRVREFAVKLYTAKLRGAGFSNTIGVECGRDRILVLAPNATIACTLFLDGSPTQLTARVRDAEGHVDFYVPPKD